MLVVILIVGVIGVLYLNFEVYHKSYGQSQAVSHNGLQIKVVDSLLTNMHTNGRVISDDKYYLAISLDITNISSESNRLDYENFKIVVNGNFLMPILDRGTYFPDLGIAYTRDMEIKSGEHGVYVLVYEITDPNTHYDLRILESLENTLIGVTPIYKNIRLDYETIIKKEDYKKYELGKIVDLSDTRFNVTELQVNSYSFTNNYVYNYQKCNGSVCQELKKTVNADPTKYGSNKELLVLDVNFKIDKSCSYYQTKKSISSFINDFICIRTRKNGNVKTYYVDSLTPSGLNNVWVLAVDNMIEGSDKIDLLVTLHGKSYVINLKDIKGNYSD